MSDTTTSASTPLLSAAGTVRLAGAGLFLIAVCYGLARFAYGLFVPVFRTTFGIEAALAGAIASGAYAAYAVTIVCASLLTPRWGARRIAIIAGAVATGGTALIATAQGPATLALGVIIAGSSTGIASPPLAHAVAQSVAEPLRNRAQTVINAGTGAGVMIAGPIALLTLDHWRLAWVIFALLCAAATTAAALTIPAPDGTRHGGARSPLVPRPTFPPGALRLLTAAALMGASSSAIWTFGRDLLVSVGGMSDHASTVLWILLGAFGLVGAVAGDLAQRWGVRRAWPGVALSMAAATVLLALAPGSPGLAGVAAAVFGAAYVAVTGLLLLWGAEVYRHHPAAGVGMAFLLLAVGQAVMSPLVGLIADQISALVAFSAAAAIGCLGSAFGPARHGRAHAHSSTGSPCPASSASTPRVNSSEGSQGN
ncbi:MFS transporter [Ruania halotolerans]|uniref:MFS transporter n=1 Tax=Ruania halotolerans TaxID=2897773 RepID=UPI001E4F3741|nr:MFS transporter [Ruania halotolerans]UFU05378.1 MFS transporter [Ruania halotolerans]